MSVTVEFTRDEAQALLAGPKGCVTLADQHALTGARMKVEQAIKVETSSGGSESPIPPWLGRPYSERAA